MNNFVLTCIIIFTSQFCFSQYQIGLIPRTSPDKSIYQKVGYTGVEITYGSPRVNNRKIWGELVPYNEVWRAGANNATTVHFDSEVLINNIPLDSATYALFVLPRKDDKWTIIFSKNAKQWGSFNYNKDDDALRVDILPRRTSNQTEQLTYSISQTGTKYGSILLAWEYLELEIPFETNYLSQFEQEVENRASKQQDYLKWIVYLQGAEYLEQIQANSDLAFDWINKAEEMMNSTSSAEWNTQFYPRDHIKGHLYWTKAKLYAQIEKFNEAVSYARKVKSLEDISYYNRKSEDENIDALLNFWESK